jgi:uncharacterized membrane protein required for colicin V production
MNWLDILIILFLTGSGVYGWYRGFFSGFVGLFSVLVGLLVSLFFYHSFAFIIVRIFNIPYDLADLISLVFLLILVSGIIDVLLEMVVKSIKPRPIVLKINRIAGSIFGVLSGILIIGGILVLFSVLPKEVGLANSLKESFFTPSITKSVSSLYQNIEKQFAGKIPRIIKYPEEVFPKEKYREIIAGTSEEEWQELDGATCFSCGGKVKYEGIKKHIVGGQEVYSPYYVCENCGRHSDSCQTYEGYHKLYGECPAVLAKKGIRFDCGMWPNGNFVKPIGRCPVCGEVAEHHHEYEQEEVVIWSWNWASEYKLAE